MTRMLFSHSRACTSAVEKMVLNSAGIPSFSSTQCALPAGICLAMSLATCGSAMNTAYLI
jgi:hypothetical protein